MADATPVTVSQVSPELQRWILAQRTAEGSLPLPVTVPAPMQNEVELKAGDRRVKVLASTATPRVVVFEGLLADDECDGLIALALERVQRSLVASPDTGEHAKGAFRTSDGMFFERGENVLCSRIERRVSDLLGWPAENAEGIQVLRYAQGGEFRPHWDYFDPAKPGSAQHIANGGQRVATVIMYLASPKRGGATVFPTIGLEVAAVKGNAVFFSYDRPDPVTGTLHAGAPVLEGEKWAATIWLRELQSARDH